MRKLLTKTSILLLLSLICSCEYAHEPKPPFQCKTSAPSTFKKDVQPIINASCVFGCHDTAGSFSSMPFNNYDQVVAATNNRNLIATVKHTAGYIAMPKDQPMLDKESIDKLTCWAENGFRK